MTSPSEPAFRTVQREVATAMTIAAAASVALLTLAYMVGQWRPLDERLAVAATAGLVIAGWLAAAIARVAMLRLQPPGAVDGEARLRDALAIQHNTLEQVVLAAPVYVALAILVDHGAMLVAASVALFSIGRMLLWAGYARGAGARALGFALTFYPTVIVLAGLIAHAALRVIS